jgi:hypothetical protein
LLFCEKIAYTVVNLVPILEGYIMSENNQENLNEAPKKKMSLQEAMKQQLENKKNKAAVGNASANNSQATKKLKSQQTKKVSNSRRKMGV